MGVGFQGAPAVLDRSVRITFWVFFLGWVFGLRPKPHSSPRPPEHRKFEHPIEPGTLEPCYGFKISRKANDVD